MIFMTDEGCQPNSDRKDFLPSRLSPLAILLRPNPCTVSGNPADDVGPRRVFLECPLPERVPFGAEPAGDPVAQRHRLLAGGEALPRPGGGDALALESTRHRKHPTGSRLPSRMLAGCGAG